jgi:hypothetical protein
MMNVSRVSIGVLLSLLVLLLAAVLWVVGRLDPMHAAFFIGLALAQLLHGHAA